VTDLLDRWYPRILSQRPVIFSNGKEACNSNPPRSPPTQAGPKSGNAKVELIHPPKPRYFSGFLGPKLPELKDNAKRLFGPGQVSVA